MTNMSRFLRCGGLAFFAAVVAPALACSSMAEKLGVDANSTGGTGTGGNGGNGGSGATPDAGSDGDGSSADTGGADADLCPVPAFSSTLDGYYVPPCHAPPTASGAWTAEAGWSARGRDISLSGDHLVLISSHGVDARRTDTGWTAQYFVWHHDEFVGWAAVDGETVAWRRDLPLIPMSTLVLPSWSGDDTAAEHALSGNTLVTTDRVFTNTGGTWGPSTIVHPNPDRTANVVALGYDRFALLRDADTRIVERQDDAWKDLGTLPAAKSVAMSPPDTDGSWLVLSARETVAGVNAVGVYTLGATGWQQQATLDAPSVALPGFGTQVSVSRPHPGAANDPGIIVVSGGPTTVTYVRAGTGAVREQDRLPLQGKALASGGNLAILSTNPIVIGTTSFERPVFVYRATF